MAQKKNKERKEQLNNFKTKIKKQMAEDQTMQELEGLRSYPIWKSQEKIEVSGLEWQSIYNVLNIFREGLVAAESVMQRNMEQGKVTMKYVDSNDKEVSTEKVAEYTKQMQALFEKRQAEQVKEPDIRITNIPGNGVSPILTQDGAVQASTTSENPLKAV